MEDIKNLKKVKLPTAFCTSFPHTKKDDPLMLFWKFMGTKMKCKFWEDSEKNTIHVSGVWVHKDVEAKLRKQVEKFAKKKFPFLVKRKIDSTVAFHMLDLSPSTSRDDLDPKYAYYSEVESIKPKGQRF